MLIALWQAKPGLAGYDTIDAVTFCFITQAFIGPMQLFGGGLTIPERIRSGDIALDLVRPASLQLWSLAEDLGRAGYLFLVRGFPPTVVGALLFGIVVPSSVAGWSAFLLCFLMGVLVSFGWRYLVALSVCWLADDRGVATASMMMSMFFSGMVLPLGLFPGWLGELARALPWAATVQVPMDVYLGTSTLLDALLFQGFWAIVLLGLGAVGTQLIRHKVVIQGG